MRVALLERSRSETIVTLAARIDATARPIEIRYATRTGALARIDGAIAGAFDREHHTVVAPASDRVRELTLEVERFALPTNGLPSGAGIRWNLLLRRAREEPRTHVDVVPVEPARTNGATQAATDSSILWGHSHLDVAWLWAYSDTKRKALRTFANALAILERDRNFTFMQSQPQLYAYVEEGDPEFFGRVRAAVQDGRFSVEPAALWVEPDCNCTSGESLLRQMLAAHRYCVDRFGIEPSLAWLPDTFGFPNTLPTLLAHAGIPFFATTKLQWNDMHRFPHPQFRWTGPDGSSVTAALLDAYEGGADARRVARARERREPVVIGYGDGGGGPTMEQVEAAERAGAWQVPSTWFETLANTALPEHRDELYLEYHRGTYTTHHDVKAKNAALERALIDVEERLAWCVAVRAPRDAVERLRASVREAWTIVLRNQFHDVLPGTSVPAAYVEVMADYERAESLVLAALSSADAMLPRGPATEVRRRCVAPREDDGEIVFDNGFVHARFNAKGSLLELRPRGGTNVVAQANLLAAYRDLPKKWEAWNLDAGYERKRLRVRPVDHRIEDDALLIRFDASGSPAEMRVALGDSDPFVRVDLAIDWRCDRTLLRMENWFTASPPCVTYGSPHGTIERSVGAPAQFEVPGQRFASLANSAHDGAAIFTLDTYGWSARALKRGGLHLGHSLLRSPRWPDPRADRGEQTLSWAFAPHAHATVEALERAWEIFASPPRVPLFTSSSGSALVVAVKPAEDGDGVVVRLRECDGRDCAVRLRCGGRMREAMPIDALERPADGNAVIEGEELVTTMPAFGLRSFRVRF